MTSSEDMIEKVARAIYESRPRNKPWGILGQHQGIYLKAARAALEAMMEPTKPMVFYGMDAMSRDGLEPTEDEFLRGFAAAIRSALSNTEGMK